MKIVQALDAPFPLDHYSAGGIGKAHLPDSDILFTWVELAFAEAFPLWHFVDKQYIEAILPRVWSASLGHAQDEGDKDDFGLLLAILALGQRFEVCEKGGYERRMQG